MHLSGHLLLVPLFSAFYISVHGGGGGGGGESQKLLFLTRQKTTPSQNLIHWALQIEVKLLQSKSTKMENLPASFSESWGTVDPPNWGPPFGLNSFPPRTSFTEMTKKVPICSQTEDSVCSFIGCWRETDTCLHSSLSVLQSPSSFTVLSVVPLLVDHSLGPCVCPFYPCQALFHRLSLGNCTAISNSFAFTIIKVCLAHSFPPS